MEAKKGNTVHIIVVVVLLIVIGYFAFVQDNNSAVKNDGESMEEVMENEGEAMENEDGDTDDEELISVEDLGAALGVANPFAPLDDSASSNNSSNTNNTSSTNTAAASATANSMQVSVYFVNQTLKPIATCSEVVKVTHSAPKSVRVGTASVDNLLAGPVASERESGYATFIPTGTVLKSLAISNGVATADFNARLMENEDSCGNSLAKAQIEATLKQFSTVSSVVIKVDGQLADL